MKQINNFFRWWFGFIFFLTVIVAIPIYGQAGIINTVGSFEGTDPSYWTKGAEPPGSTLEWAQDQSLLLGRSLKITKSVTTEAAKWTSENMCDNWAPTRAANSMIQLQAWVKTEGINTNPATDDEKWMIQYSYYDQSGTFIGAVPIDLDQSVGTSDWTAVRDSVSLPTEAYKVIIEVIGGKDATGTVWADAFKWPSDWNQTLEFPTGWFNWFPFSSDSAISNGYENTRITTEEAHTGLHSLKFDLPFGRAPQDAFVGTKRVLLGNGINPGDMLRISVWVKASNLVPDSAALYPETWAVGLTPLWHKAIGNNAGYDPSGPDLMFKFPAVTSFDWTEYYIDIQVPDDGTIALEVRIHPYSRFTGTIYFDDLKVKVIQKATGVEGENGLPVSYDLSQNYPNPFNPTTIIRYSLPTNSFVTLRIYDILGREVKTLINTEQNSGTYNVQWNGDNNYGTKVSSGIYLYRIEAANYVMTKKMIMLK